MLFGIELNTTYVAAGVGALLVVLLLWAINELRKGLSFNSVEGLTDGGTLVAQVLVNHDIDTLFCLSGGHIAPVYVEAEKAGIKVVDVRHEVNSVFAADAYARLTGKVGVACVTAGPGVTNTITAVQNAKMAQSPVLILGGATSTLLKGRGSLQDIDHMTLMHSLVKYSASPSCVAEIVPAVEEALRQANTGVPGPVFVELCMDLTWPAPLIIEEAQGFIPKNTASLMAKVTKWYVTRHINNIFAGANSRRPRTPRPLPDYPAAPGDVQTVCRYLARSERPVFVFGSQAMLRQADVDDMVAVAEKIGAPMYLASMARGLMGVDHPLHMRHSRGQSLKTADLVVLVGVVCDFRLKYGFAINSRATLVCVNRSAALAKMNRSPTLAIAADPATFYIQLGAAYTGAVGGLDAWAEWKAELQARDDAKCKSIDENAREDPKERVNPVHLCQRIHEALDDDSILVVDGGDFVGTAAYTVQPRGPLSWLDPGQFGTLGVGAGFAMAAQIVRPDAEVWIMYGDGACGFSIAEFDTFARFKLGVIAIIGNDAGWTQMLRDQDRLLNSHTACHLTHAAYDVVAEGFGGRGLVIEKKEEIDSVLAEAKKIARTGVPVLVNCMIARNDFRKGAISV